MIAVSILGKSNSRKYGIGKSRVTYVHAVGGAIGAVGSIGSAHFVWCVERLGVGERLRGDCVGRNERRKD